MTKANIKIVPRKAGLFLYLILCSGNYLLFPEEYHRHYCVSLPCSEWERVVPQRRATRTKY